MDIILDILLNILLTGCAYVAFPLICLGVNHGKFAKKKARKITLWNSIVLGALFCIITIAISDGKTIWNGSTAAIYYFINYAILTDHSIDRNKSTPKEDKSENSTFNQNNTKKNRHTTYYDLLEISENASAEVIHMAYKALCKKYHPDVFAGDKTIAEDQIKKINTAYTTLSDPEKRKEYDDLLNNHQNNAHSNVSQKKSSTKKTKPKNIISSKKKLYIGIGLFLGVLFAGIVIATLCTNSRFLFNTEFSGSDNTVSSQTFGEWTEEKKEKSNFLDEHIVFVIEGDETRYYTYDQMMAYASLMDEFSYWAYNKEQAISLGYVACDNILVPSEWSTEKADFLDEHIVFTIEGFGNYYYTYDEMISATWEMEEYQYLAYNTEQAIGLGYTSISAATNDYTSKNYSNDKQALNTPVNMQSHKTTCLSVGCDNLPNNRGFYCSEHACAKSGCTSEKTNSSSFCNSHKCDSIGCDNGRNDSGYYCSEHACTESGCFREKDYSYSSLYCSYHECNDVGCTNRKKDYGSYCSEHECADRYCTSQKSVLSDYCFIHDD